MRDNTKNTQFHFAGVKRSLVVIRMLHAQGGREDGGTTATSLHEISEKGRRRVLWLLLEHCADAGPGVYDPFPDPRAGPNRCPR